MSAAPKIASTDGTNNEPRGRVCATTPIATIARIAPSTHCTQVARIRSGWPGGGGNTIQNTPYRTTPTPPKRVSRTKTMRTDAGGHPDVVGDPAGHPAEDAMPSTPIQPRRRGGRFGCGVISRRHPTMIAGSPPVGIGRCPHLA